MSEEKVNNYGKIPSYTLSTLWHGRFVYIREVTEKHFMKKYQGFGLSTSVMPLMDKEKEIVFVYKGRHGTTTYIAKVKQFMESKQEWQNTGEDLQKFVSIREMQIVK
jgi:hypothetical protein